MKKYQNQIDTITKNIQCGIAYSILDCIKISFSNLPTSFDKVVDIQITNYLDEIVMATRRNDDNDESDDINIGKTIGQKIINDLMVADKCATVIHTPPK